VGDPIPDSKPVHHSRPQLTSYAANAVHVYPETVQEHIERASTLVSNIEASDIFDVVVSRRRSQDGSGAVHYYVAVTCGPINNRKRKMELYSHTGIEDALRTLLEALVL
jgi:hypothetical protein